MIKWVNPRKPFWTGTWLTVSSRQLFHCCYFLLLWLFHVLQVSQVEKISFLALPTPISTCRPFLHLPLAKLAILPSPFLWSHCYSFIGHCPWFTNLALGLVFLVIQILSSLDNLISNQSYPSNLIDSQVLGLLVSDDLVLHSTSVHFLWIIPEISSSTESALSPTQKCKHSTVESQLPILFSSLFK